MEIKSNSKGMTELKIWVQIKVIRRRAEISSQKLMNVIRRVKHRRQIIDYHSSLAFMFRLFREKLHISKKCLT